jgi:peptidoglycan/LPS O-acetylase OafA/YrhL
MKPNNRFQTLDLLRIFSALWVMTYHCSGGLGRFSSLKKPYESIISGNFLPEPIAIFFRLGFLGVPIFFVISGYVIYESSRTKSQSEFYISRFSRLAPAYFISLLVAILIGFTPFGFQIVKGTFLDSIFSSVSLTSTPLGVIPIQQSYWTLWPEICFFFLFSITLFKFKILARWKIDLYFFALWIYLVLIASGTTGFLSEILVTQYACYFVLGASLAMVSHTRRYIFLFPLIILSTCMSFINLKRWILSWDASFPSDYRAGFVIFSCALMLVGASRKIYIPRFSKTISVLGNSSFPIYLFQEGVGVPLISLLVYQGVELFLAIAIGVIFIVIIAIGFHLYFEKFLIAKLKQQMTIELGN